MNKQIDIAAQATLGFQAAEPAGTASETRFKEKLRALLVVGFPVLLAAIGSAYYFVDEPYVSTDNAYARVAKASQCSRIRPSRRDRCR